jgi:molybdopterin converting factor small subunit
VNEPIEVTVLLFATLGDTLGRNVPLRVPAATPVGAVWSLLPEPVSSAAPPTGLRYALNGTWATPGEPLRDGDRVALILPVSGG